MKKFIRVFIVTISIFLSIGFSTNIVHPNKPSVDQQAYKIVPKLIEDEAGDLL
ncbi:hypothetical protein [Aquibacillus kalidii]|uniref:hypothetical protein n=1 Tax=Aquibacillus kalidii TaxID=2762597 RepID=UPI00164667D5|nr:hypothetical protein [Aquibacillus kalidii]